MKEENKIQKTEAEFSINCACRKILKPAAQISINKNEALETFSPRLKKQSSVKRSLKNLHAGMNQFIDIRGQYIKRGYLFEKLQEDSNLVVSQGKSNVTEKNSQLLYAKPMFNSKKIYRVTSANETIADLNRSISTLKMQSVIMHPEIGNQKTSFSATLSNSTTSNLGSLSGKQKSSIRMTADSISQNNEEEIKIEKRIVVQPDCKMQKIINKNAKVGIEPFQQSLSLNPISNIQEQQPKELQVQPIVRLSNAGSLQNLAEKWVQSIGTSKNNEQFDFSVVLESYLQRQKSQQSLNLPKEKEHPQIINNLNHQVDPRFVKRCYSYNSPVSIQSFGDRGSKENCLGFDKKP